MYIVKVKGVAKIPDYVQLRDDEFTLLAYFRVDRPDKSLEKLVLGIRQHILWRLCRSFPLVRLRN